LAAQRKVLDQSQATLAVANENKLTNVINACLNSIKRQSDAVLVTEKEVAELCSVLEKASSNQVDFVRDAVSGDVHNVSTGEVVSDSSGALHSDVKVPLGRRR